MNNHFLSKVSLTCPLWLLVLLAGCSINIGGCDLTAKYERQVQLSAPLQPGSIFALQNFNGSVTVRGAGVNDCNVSATITARATTEDQAKELAELIEIQLQPSDGKLTAKMQKPDSIKNKHFSIKFDVTVPNQTDLNLKTHNGAMKITNIKGDTRAETFNGSFTAERIAGTAWLKTHNGSVKCTEISGDATLKTFNGGVKVFYSEDAPADCNVSMTTFNGGIELTPPPNFSAAVEASTHNGSVNTDLPITVTGELSKKKLVGTIGAGEGKLRLETFNGSIKINDR